MTMSSGGPGTAAHTPASAGAGTEPLAQFLYSRDCLPAGAAASHAEARRHVRRVRPQWRRPVCRDPEVPKGFSIAIPGVCRIII